MNPFLQKIGQFLPFFEGQEKNFLNTNIGGIVTAENARLNKKLGRTVCSADEIATFAKVFAELVCAEEEALVKP